MLDSLQKLMGNLRKEIEITNREYYSNSSATGLKLHLWNNFQMEYQVKISAEGKTTEHLTGVDHYQMH